MNSLQVGSEAGLAGGCLIRRMLKAPLSQHAQSSFFAGCFMLLSFKCRMLQAPLLQDASWLLMCPSCQVMLATLLTFDVAFVEVVWVR